MSDARKTLILIGGFYFPPLWLCLLFGFKPSAPVAVAPSVDLARASRERIASGRLLDRLAVTS